MEPRAAADDGDQHIGALRSSWSGWIVAAIASLVFLVGILGPPHLMDDVDAVQAQAARNMLASGDWVTARLDGIAYLEKAPLNYWMIAVAYRIFGVYDWAARLPHALVVVLLCWVTCRFGRWAFDETTGLYAGIALATCAGLFLFTRILANATAIPRCRRPQFTDLEARIVLEVIDYMLQKRGPMPDRATARRACSSEYPYLSQTDS